MTPTEHDVDGLIERLMEAADGPWIGPVQMRWRLHEAAAALRSLREGLVLTQEHLRQVIEERTIESERDLWKCRAGRAEADLSRYREALERAHDWIRAGAPKDAESISILQASLEDSLTPAPTQGSHLEDGWCPHPFCKEHRSTPASHADHAEEDCHIVSTGQHPASQPTSLPAPTQEEAKP